MKVKHLGEIIATRQLILAGSKARVAIKIGQPARFPDGQDYFCPYRVVGLGNDSVRYAGGVDSIQAFLLALKKIGAELYASAEYKEGKLYWLEIGNKDLGFPVPDGFDLKPK